MTSEAQYVRRSAGDTECVDSFLSNMTIPQRIQRWTVRSAVQTSVSFAHCE